MVDHAVLHTVLGERLGADGRDKFYQIQCFGRRVHQHSLQLPDAILNLYIKLFDHIPKSLGVLCIEDINLVLAQFEGNDPLLAMPELEKGDIDGLLLFCRLFCYVQHPVLKKSKFTTLELPQEPPVSPQVIQLPSISEQVHQLQATRLSQLPSTSTHHTQSPTTSFTSSRTRDAKPRTYTGTSMTYRPSSDSSAITRRELLHNPPPTARNRGARRRGVMNPSSYGAPYYLNLGLCYYVFSSARPCPSGEDCPNRHRWFSLSEVDWIRPVAGPWRWENMRRRWSLPEPPVLRTRFVEVE